VQNFSAHLLLAPPLGVGRFVYHLSVQSQTMMITYYHGMYQS
jgi:hypothetical protein